MIRIMILLISVISFCHNTHLFSQEQKIPVSIGCSPEIQPYVLKMQKMPEIRELVEKVCREGPIKILRGDKTVADQFGACWEGERRIIFVNLSGHQDEGKIIGSLIFELHNAAVTSRYQELDLLASLGQIDRENYVRSTEYVEYLNSKSASAIVEKGIRSGLFPVSARLHTYSDFDEHYRMQIFGGHSAWISRNYDLIMSEK